MIETIKRERPTLSLREICDGLTEFGGIPKGTSRSAISRALNNNVVWFKIRISWKKISTIAEERFTVENTAYTQMFMDYLHAKDHFKLKSFNECGVKLPFHGKRLYGHAPVGPERFILNSCVITVHLT